MFYHDRLDIGQDPRDVPNAFLHYEGPWGGYDQNFGQAVPGYDQLGARTQHEMAVRDMEERRLLDDRMRQPMFTHQAPLPLAESSFSDTEQYAPAPSTSASTSALAPVPQRIGYDRPAPRQQPVMPDNPKDFRRAVRLGVFAAATAAAVFVAAQLFPDREETPPGATSATEQYDPSFQCSVNGFGEISNSEVFLDVSGVQGEPLGARNVAAAALEAGQVGGAGVSLATPNASNEGQFIFKATGLHDKTLGIYVDNATGYELCGVVNLGKPGTGDESFVSGNAGFPQTWSGAQA